MSAEPPVLPTVQCAATDALMSAVTSAVASAMSGVRMALWPHVFEPGPRCARSQLAKAGPVQPHKPALWA